MPTSELPSFSDIGTTLVTLEVGTSHQKHVVHKDLLTAESPYSRAMFEGKWKESTLQQPAILSTASDVIFPRFLNWLYFRSALTEPKVEGCGACGADCDWDKELPENPSFELDKITDEDDVKLESLITTVQKDSLMHLYIFADQFDVPALRKDVINALWAKYMQNWLHPSYRIIIACWRQLPASSPLCRLLLATLVNAWSPAEDDCCPTERKMRTTLPATLLFELAAQLQLKRDNYQALGPICEYHEHKKDEASMDQCLERMREKFDAMAYSYLDWQYLEDLRNSQNDNMSSRPFQRRPPPRIQSGGPTTAAYAESDYSEGV